KEVAAVETGPVEFGMFTDPLGLLLVTRFGAVMSFDCSYSWHRMVKVIGDRSLPPAYKKTSPELRALCTIILVDARTCLVLALRAVTFDPPFTRAIHRAITDQASAADTPGLHGDWAQSMMRFTTDQLWDRCTIRCRGGE